MYARELVGKAPCRRMNLCVYLEVWVIFPYLSTLIRQAPTEVHKMTEAGGLLYMSVS